MNVPALWEKWSKFPMGRKLFSWSFGRHVPYSGSICPEILELKPGYARVQMRDRKRVRNHLKSIHAVALMNLAEASSGLSLHAGMSANLRAILVNYEMKFGKKARGTLTAEAKATLPPITTRTEVPCEVVVKNEAGEVVCSARAIWLVEPRSPSKNP